MNAKLMDILDPKPTETRTSEEIINNIKNKINS